MLQLHFIFYCALCLARGLSHKPRIYRVAINETRTVDIPPAHCLSTRSSHLLTRPTLLLFLFYTLRVPRILKFCSLFRSTPTSVLRIIPPTGPWSYVTGCISITPSTLPERLLVMFGKLTTSLCVRFIINVALRHLQSHMSECDVGSVVFVCLVLRCYRIT